MQRHFNILTFVDSKARPSRLMVAHQVGGGQEGRLLQHELRQLRRCVTVLDLVTKISGQQPTSLGLTLVFNGEYHII